MPDGTYSIECEGVFDLQAALGLEHALGLVAEGRRVEVDLSRVREFHDAGLAILGRAIQRAGATHHLDVRGLTDRHRRLLRYLGVDLGPHHHRAHRREGDGDGRA